MVVQLNLTDRQTDKLFDTIYCGMWIFISVKFATSLLAYSQGEYQHKYKLDVIILDRIESTKFSAMPTTRLSHKG